MDNKREHKDKDKIPDFIIELSKNKLGKYPSIIETDYYTYKMFEDVKEKNNIIWSHKFYNGNDTIYNRGLLEFSDSEIMFYFEKRKDEYAYKFYCLSNEDSYDSIIFYLNKFKQYKLIT